jgi:5S rRNA maturation endonuclease (ribonuclease M5)
MTPLENVLERLEGARRAGKGYQALCPAHEDRKPSLAVVEAQDGRVLVRCHAGCDASDVVAALGMTMADLFPVSNGNGRDPIIAEYDYVSEDGALLFQVVRLEPKSFRQRRPKPDGGWEWSLNGVRRVPFRLPRVIEAARKGEGIFVVEGEKDVLALERLGQVATCNPGGVGKWRAEYAEALRGAQVVVVADRDDAGREHARQVAEALEGVAADVEVVEPASGKDVSDHLAAGKSLGELVPFEEETPTGEGEVRVEGLRRLDVGRMVRETPPPIPWRVEPLVADGHLTMLYAVPGEGKSLLAAALAAATAHGEEIAGLACRRGRSLYIDAENGEGEIHRRIKTLGLPADGVAMYEANGFDLRRGVEGLERLVQAEQADLLILDSLRSLAPGLEENDPAQVSSALDPLRHLAHRTGVAVLVIHHANKAGQDYRGTSAILASVDLAYRLGRADGEDRSLRFLEPRKVRIAAEPPKRWLRLSVERGMVLIDEADGPSEEPGDSAAAPARDDLVPRVEVELGAEPRTRADIARAVGRDAKDGSVGRVLDYLASKGRAAKVDGRWKVPGATAPGPLGGWHLGTLPGNPHRNGENGGTNEGATTGGSGTLSELPVATAAELAKFDLAEEA